MGDRIHSENYAIEGYRKCGICGIEKHVSDFPRRMSGKYEGALLFCCAACNKERVHAWNKAHPKRSLI